MVVIKIMSLRTFSFLVAAFIFSVVASFALPAFASGGEAVHNLNVGLHWAGLLCIGIFVLSYAAVLVEEYTHMRKSKPVMLGAGLIWIVVAYIAPDYGVDKETLHEAIMHGLKEYSALMLFLLSAMTYISALEDRNVFAVIRMKLVLSGMNLRQLFWATGILAFFLSPIADNLTTALVMGAVIMAVGRSNSKFITLGCINIVSAANAGGAFSPFGDITTLMVWQSGHLEFFDFFALFFPSVVCFLIPALIMSFFVSNEKPETIDEHVEMKQGAKVIIGLAFLTITMAVGLEQTLGLPPFIGMMTGMSLLMIAAWFIRQRGTVKDKDFDILKNVASAEWDTLLFFFGVIFSVGGLAFLGYLEFMSTTFYDGWGPSITNIILGFFSAIIDNIPVMFAVLTMSPDMDHFQWLLITLTAGVGGSMLSIGSAAGVALMGVARGYYTFVSHLKWAPVLFLGYAASIAVHFLLNAPEGTTLFLVN
ncbi:MAG: sodium:proton antiporter [Zetaproteobacteria bacterium]|nr:MAG: sodium:proton antiporter [Zetaproteobacteria bacterium]